MSKTETNGVKLSGINFVQEIKSLVSLGSWRDVTTAEAESIARYIQEKDQEKEETVKK